MHAVDSTGARAVPARAACCYCRAGNGLRRPFSLPGDTYWRVGDARDAALVRARRPGLSIEEGWSMRALVRPSASDTNRIDSSFAVSVPSGEPAIPEPHGRDRPNGIAPGALPERDARRVSQAGPCRGSWSSVGRRGGHRVMLPPGVRRSDAGEWRRSRPPEDVLALGVSFDRQPAEPRRRATPASSPMDRRCAAARAVPECAVLRARRPPRRRHAGRSLQPRWTKSEDNCCTPFPGKLGRAAAVLPPLVCSRQHRARAATSRALRFPTAQRAGTLALAALGAQEAGASAEAESQAAPASPRSPTPSRFEVKSRLFSAEPHRDPGREGVPFLLAAVFTPIPEVSAPSPR